MKIAIMTDTHSGIMPEAAKAYEDVYVLAAPFIVDGVQHAEGVDLQADAFYRSLESGADVSTSQASPGDVLQMWDSLLERYDQIVCIMLSSSLTSGHQTMVMLAQEEPYAGRVFCVDNNTVSVTEELAVQNAAALVKQGCSGEEIQEILEDARKNNLIYITVATLKYLKKGGRITPAAAALGTLLKIKPVLEIDGGKLDAFAKVRTMSQAKDTMLTAIQTALDGRLQDHDAAHCYIMIAHTQNDEAAAELLALAKERWPKAEFRVAPLALALACHTGPGALAIVAERKLAQLEQ